MANEFCRMVFKKDTQQKLIDEKKAFFEKLLSPDHELLVWEKWINIRKEETLKLSNKLKRPPIDLVMNLPENVREDKERKIVLEHAQIEKKPTVRDTLFERPPRLKQRCYCAPVYEIQRTPAELGHPNVIEHIGVPSYIQETELGMSGVAERKICDQLNADYIKYREKREEELCKKIVKIDPFRASTSKLIIKGHKPKTPPPKIPPLPAIIINDATNISQDLWGIHAVKINKTILFKELSDQNLDYLQAFQKDKCHEKCTSWTYYFNIPAKRVGRAKLFMQNLGTVSLRYCWKRIKKSLQFIPADIHEPVFFFNKNEDVLSPGQCKEICFTFISDSPGIYSEFWELTFLTVCFFDTVNEKLSVHLCADATEDAETKKRKVEILKTKIHRAAMDMMAYEILNEIFDKIFIIVPETYPYKKYFLEAELFVMKNPVCFYHQTEVAKMKEMYLQMAPKQTWDLSIGSWREVMMSKQFDERMQYFDALKKSHSECLKPWYEGEDLVKKKYRAVYDLWGGLADKLDKEYARICDMYAPQEVPDETLPSTIVMDPIPPMTLQTIRNIFFLHAYEHVAATIELCAGVLSSLDLNRWIEFDFCRT